MRIAMIHRPDAARVFGGDVVVMEQLAAALRELGVEVVLGREGEMPPASTFDLLHVFDLAPLDYAQRMAAWAKAGGCRLVFSPLYYNDFRDWFARAIITTTRWRTLAKMLGEGAAWQVYRAWQTARLPAQPAWRGMRQVLIAADTIASTSAAENAWYAEHFRLPEDVRRRMALSRFGIDAGFYGQEFGPAELAAFRGKYGLAEPYVVEVARIESKKNQLAVIEALWDEAVDLVFVGAASPYFAPDYAERCYAAGARRGRTHFLGWLPKAELPLAYAASAAHILPSWNELPGLSSLEAGACGTRVISTQYSSLRELLGPDVWTVDPYDRRSIRETTLAALNSPAPGGLRQRLLKEFDWRAAARVNLGVYERTLADHPPMTPILAASSKANRRKSA